MEPASRYDSLFQTYAEWDRTRAGEWVRRPVALNWLLLKRQAIAESGLNPDAISPVGAQGLSQFMTATFIEWATKQFGSEKPPRRHVSPYDPEDAIWAQADVMAWLLKIWGGDIRKALASYNWGIGRVTKVVKALDANWETALPAETAAYLRKILP